MIDLIRFEFNSCWLIIRNSQRSRTCESWTDDHCRNHWNHWSSISRHWKEIQTLNWISEEIQITNTQTIDVNYSFYFVVLNGNIRFFWLRIFPITNSPTLTHSVSDLRDWRDSGFLATMRYIGLKMPSFPPSTKATAVFMSNELVAVVPRGAIRKHSKIETNLCMWMCKNNVNHSKAQKGVCVCVCA